MSDQLCVCGTSPGFLHAPDCPYPLYHAPPGSALEAHWLVAQAEVAGRRCPICRQPIAPDDVDVRAVVGAPGVREHAACSERAKAALAQTAGRFAAAAQRAHREGGWCPWCRAVREANSVCWSV